MADKFSKAKRSIIMSKVRSKDTEPEIFIRKFLFSQGFRYRKNVKALPGTPDIVMRKYKTVIFINGCFWHGHSNCKKSVLPLSNISFWKQKIIKNFNRDILNQKQLFDLGWKVILVWECEIKNKQIAQLRLIKLLEEIKSNC